MVKSAVEVDRVERGEGLGGWTPSTSSTMLAARLRHCHLSEYSSAPQSSRPTEDARHKIAKSQTSLFEALCGLSRRTEEGVGSAGPSGPELTPNSWTPPSTCRKTSIKRPLPSARGKTTWDKSTGRWTWEDTALRDRRSKRRSTTDAITALHKDLSARLSSLTALALSFEVQRRQDRISDVTKSWPPISWSEASTDGVDATL